MEQASVLTQRLFHYLFLHILFLSSKRLPRFLPKSHKAPTERTFSAPNASVHTHCSSTRPDFQL
ncbi:hypothetical protein AAER81_16355, partial [Acinetobacter baumannii]|uniref:hypothetical protein n=1 Tax=Acinetobacter baumannii TaxID=470 RepID=UPI0031F33888